MCNSEMTMPFWLSKVTRFCSKKCVGKNMIIKAQKTVNCRIADNKCNGRLEAHHILNWKQYPELRYELNNGITLCQSHHPRGRENENKLSPYLQHLVAEMK